MLQVSSSSIIIDLIFLCLHFLIFKCVISTILILKKFLSSVLRNAWYGPRPYVIIELILVGTQVKNSRKLCSVFGPLLKIQPN